jgi:hypothetical protein
MSESSQNQPAGQGQNAHGIFCINPPDLRRSFWIYRFFRPAASFRIRAWQFPGDGCWFCSRSFWAGGQLFAAPREERAYAAAVAAFNQHL